MRPIATHVVAWSVCVYVTWTNPAEMAETIKFGMWAEVGPHKHVLDGSGSPQGNGQFWG